MQIMIDEEIMMKTNLIIVEGMPGSGKSTTAQYISMQLNKNSIPSNWYYEVESNHPLECFDEAYLNENDYQDLLLKFPEYKSILEMEVIKKNSFFIFKYLLINEKYKNNLPNELIDYFEKVETSHLDTKQYMEFKKDKWKAHFIDALDTITVIESSLFQTTIIELLLRNEKKSVIKAHVNDLIKIVSKEKPTLIYLYKKDMKQAITELFQNRGQEFIDYMIDLIEQNRYGKSQSLKGNELVFDFFKKYLLIADELFKKLKVNKLSIDNTKEDWNSLFNIITNFLEIEQKLEKEVSKEILESYEGKYENVKLNRVFYIKYENDDLVFYLNDTYKERLIPINTNSFSCQGNSMDIIFLKDINNVINRFIIAGRSIASSYAQCGSIFMKLD